MARGLAGVFGSAAFVVVMARGVIESGAIGATVTAACVALFVFAAIGWLVGRIGEGIVLDSVRSQLRETIRARETTEKTDTAASQ